MNKKLSKIALDILGIILALICLSPFYIIIVNSFKTKGELFESTLALPEKFNLDNYTRAWEQLDFIKVLGNSLFITVISIVFIVLFASMAAWMLQRTNSKISNMILFIFARFYHKYIIYIYIFNVSYIPIYNVASYKYNGEIKFT